MMTLQCKTRLVKASAALQLPIKCMFAGWSHYHKWSKDLPVKMKSVVILLCLLPLSIAGQLFRKSIKGLIIRVLNKSQVFQCSLQVCQSQTMMRTGGFSLMMAAENWSVSKGDCDSDDDCVEGLVCQFDSSWHGWGKDHCVAGKTLHLGWFCLKSLNYCWPINGYSSQVKASWLSCFNLNSLHH